MSDFKENFIISVLIIIILICQSSWKYLLWDPICSMRQTDWRNDRQTDMTKVIVTLRNFSKALINLLFLRIVYSRTLPVILTSKGHFVALSTFNDQNLHKILCIVDHKLILALTRFGINWHSLQGSPFNCIAILFREHRLSVLTTSSGNTI
jgi:hypothetical protein